MKKGSIFVASLLLASTFVIVSSTSRSYAEDELGHVVVSSGSNRFLVWQDDTPGNYDILFKRSTDNGATWMSTINLSNNAGPSFRPQIAVAGSNVYVIWFQVNAAETAADIFFRKSTDNGGTWGPKTNLSGDGKANSELDSAQNRESDIAASGSNVYITWERKIDSVHADVLFRRSTDNGATWKVAVPISNTGNDFQDQPQLAASGSNVYLVWLEDIGDKVLFRRSTDNGATWKAVVQLSSHTGSNGKQVPQLAVSGSNIYVIWRDIWFLYFRSSTDGGATWNSIKFLSGSYTVNRPDIAASGLNVYVVWTRTDSEASQSDAFFRRSTDGGVTWKSTINLSNSQSGENPQIAVSGSNVYVAWYDSGDAFSRRSTDSGATWKSIKNLSNNAGNSFVPQIAVSGSNVYVAWSDNTPVNNEIFFKRSADDGSTWTGTKNLSNNGGDSFLVQIGV